MDATATALQVVPQAPAPVIHGYQPEYLALLNAVLAEARCSLNRGELDLFLYRSWHSGLDPLSKQVYAIKRYDKKQAREVMTIQTGIDGYRAIADRTCQYAGSDAPVYEIAEDGRLLSATVTVWKLVGGARCSFAAQAYWDEYVPQDGQDFMWRKMPRGQLAKVAEALALRKGFPAQLSGIYVKEEMDQAYVDVEGQPGTQYQAPPEATTAAPASYSAPSTTAPPPPPRPAPPAPAPPPPPTRAPSADYQRPGQERFTKPLDTRAGTATAAQANFIYSLAERDLGWTREEAAAFLIQRFGSSEMAALSKSQVSEAINELKAKVAAK